MPLEIAGYQRLVEIGRGGFAVVFRAEDARFRRTVAIKVLHTSLDAGDRSLFERECEAIGMVSRHPNCVTVFDSGFADDGSPYLVMEDMTGGSLAERLADGPVAWAEVLEIGIGLAGALQTAHDAGVLHRDVKPDNVLVSEFGTAKLADFGVARLEGRALTRTGRTPFTPTQAAPEVLDGDRSTAASDVYSLGSTLFTLIAGEPPFARADDESAYALMARVVRDPPPDLRARGIPGEVCAALEAALAKAPADRPASAAELGRRLQGAQTATGQTPTRLVVNEPPDTARAAVAATPPLPVRRSPRLAAIVAGILFVVAAGGVTYALTRDGGGAGGDTSSRRGRVGIGGPAAIGRPRLTIDVGPRPDGVAFGGDAVWVANRGDDTVWRVSPAGRVSDKIPVGSEPSDVLVAHGSVWVANAGTNTVTRLDPATRTVTETIEVGSAPSGLAADETSVWVANTADASVSRIDPATNDVLEIAVGASPLQVAAGAGAVWVTNYGEDSVSRIDPATNEPVEEIPVADKPYGVVADADSVWVSSFGDRTVQRIDPRTNRIDRRVDVGRSPTELATTDGFVWVVNSRSHTMTQIDETRGKVVATIASGPQPFAIDAGEGALWVTNYLDAGTLSRISE